MKFGSKKAIFGVICFFFRGLDLVWESATPPTHIWERYPKKKFFGGGQLPLSNDLQVSWNPRKGEICLNWIFIEEDVYTGGCLNV